MVFDVTPRSLGVVAATIGRPERMEPFVAAVLRDAGVGELVIVVDGGDPDTVRVLEELAAGEPRLRVLAVSRRGQLAALDAGVQASSSDVVVLMDDDVLPTDEGVSGHLRHHQEAPGLVVVGTMPVDTSEGEPPSRATRMYAADYDNHVDALRRGDVGVLDVLWTGNLSMRRTDCLRVGLDNPCFPAHYHADRDLGYRLAGAGFTGRFDPSIAARHLHRRSDEELLRDAVRQGAGLVALHRAHPDRLPAFRLRQLADDLGPPLRWLVAALGSSRLAPGAARVLTRVAEPWERATGRAGHGDPLAPAKLARRIMQRHGARQALRVGRHETVPEGTGKDAPA